MPVRSRLSLLVAAVWAGVSLGGCLIAAPAKFTAPSLTLSTALEVGRAQFYYIGIAEFVLASLLFATAISVHSLRFWAAVPIALFLLQKLGVMPNLDARTLQLISGDTLEQSSLHAVYIVLEVAKFFALTLFAFVSAILLAPTTLDSQMES